MSLQTENRTNKGHGTPINMTSCGIYQDRNQEDIFLVKT